MVYPFLSGSTLLRTQQIALPRTFCRYKSITSAIERGRQSGTDRPFRPRPQTNFRDRDGDGNEGPVKNRREARLERFGPPRDGPPSRGRDGVTAPRSSRFGRVGPPRPRDDDAPSRVEREKLVNHIFSATDGPKHRWADKPRTQFAREAQLDVDGNWRSGERSKKRFDEGGERRPRQEGFGGRPRTPYSERRDFGREDGGGDRRDFRSDRPERSSNRDFKSDRPERSFNREDRAGGTRDFKSDRPERSFNREEGGSERKEFGSERPERSFNRDFKSDRPERSFRREDGSSSYSRRTPENGDEPTREPRFSHRPDSKGARRERNGREQSDVPSEHKGDAERSLARGPESLPYTTAASEFIYGHSSVLAAIKANRRKFYTLYVHMRAANRDSSLMSRIRENKLFAITKEVGDEYMRALDKASSGRPHNGVILESSPLPVPPVTELRAPSIEDESFSVALDSQSQEDLAVNGKQEMYSYKSAGWRHPLILYVDGVVDEGNLGAIARSAYLLGVDAIITPTHHTANWSHIALKASAGAAEAIPLFKTGEPTDFLGKCSRAGWMIYASDAVPPVSSTSTETTDPASSKVVYTIARSTKRLPVDHSPVAEHPTILMMGAEATGLKTSLLNLAHYKVGIPHGREVNEVGVDSLNVSVAASILCYEMLQKPVQQPKKDPEDVLF